MHSTWGTLKIKREGSVKIKREGSERQVWCCRGEWQCVLYGWFCVTLVKCLVYGLKNHGTFIVMSITQKR